MPDYKEIYSQHAGQYDLLVSCEDYQGNIPQALERIRPLDGLDVVELGAGTGRLTCTLAPVVASIQAFDASQHMLDVAAARLEKSGRQNWRMQVADHRDLPAADQCADLAISGWSVCYIVVEHEETWRDELDKVLAEMKRVLRPGGAIILLESLGTGYNKPRPPKSLGEYYKFLEKEGFASNWIRTDYRFESLQEAQALTRFFFGEDKVDKIINDKVAVLPEYTSVWWLSV